MPAVTRIGDADVPHCSGMFRAMGSPDIFINMIALSRMGDVNTPHLLPGVPCPAHAAPITIGSTKVLNNMLGFGRIGDMITMCTAVAQGSSDVFSS